MGTDSWESGISRGVCMGRYLSEFTGSRDNNFNLIRFLAAFLVLFSHSFALVYGTKQAEPLRTTLGMTWGGIAVDVFFVTSGFLITGSYFSRNNLTAFIWARVLRIYPALIVSMFFCVFVLGPSLSVYGIGDYLADSQAYLYFVKNSFLFLGVEYELPGVFMENPWGNTVNGSLWTLPHEVRMYASLAVFLVGLSLLRTRWKRVGFRSAMLLMGLLALGFHIFNHFHPVIPSGYIKLFSMFYVGGAMYLWRDRILLSGKWFLLALAALLASTAEKDAFFVVYCLVLPYLVFFLAYVPGGVLREFNKLGDYSYGLYIYAFPIQQTVVALLDGASVGEVIVLSFLGTLFLAVLSWHLIEKRCLRLKGSYVAVEGVLRRFVKFRVGDG